MFDLITKSICGNELAREIINVPSITYGIHATNLVAVIKDGASVNGAAMWTVGVVYPEAAGITCFSHILNGVGEHFSMPNFSDLLTQQDGGVSWRFRIKCLSNWET